MGITVGVNDGDAMARQLPVPLIGELPVIQSIGRTADGERRKARALSVAFTFNFGVF